MADDESRAVRQKALAEKKRRLEEIKARRRQPGAAAAAAAAPSGGASANAATSTSGGAGAGLDSYIDDLLKTSAPGLTLVAPTEEAPAAEEKAEEANKGENASEATGDAAGGAAPTSDDAGNASAQPSRQQRPAVETFEIAIQCEEDDFPPPSLIDEDEQPADDKDSDDSDDDDDDNEGGGASDDRNNNEALRRGISSGSAILPSSSDAAAGGGTAEPPSLLSPAEKSKLLASPPFAQFLSTAGKRVERLLGAGEESLYGILGGSGWGDVGGVASGGGDFSVDYANEEDDDDDYDDYGSDEEVADGVGGSRKKRRSKKKHKEEAYQSGGYFTARATYEFPKFTQGRCVTDVEWCPGHREWILASYNAVGAGARNAQEDSGSSNAGMMMASMLNKNNPTTRHLSPHDPSSSSLQAAANNSLSSFHSPSAIPNEGIVAIYNLSMPSRPEHVFCAGCPILHSKFHPTEHPKLILGGASSGQVLVWDARVGRYPVQRSGGGHDCELVGMKVLGGDSNSDNAGGAGGLTTSKLVTASSDGKINYWSVANLREPAECVTVDANLCSLEVLHGSNEGILCGDERGGLHAVTAGTGRDGTSGSNKRVVRTLHPGGVGTTNNGDGAEDDAAAEEAREMGHFGMVTSVAARPSVSHANTPRGGNKETTSAVGGGGSSKGFLRGAGGLVVTTGVDWSTKLWAPAHADGPLMSFLSNSYDYMCDAQWSPVHPSVFATASSNGTLNIWNLATTLDQPVSGTEGIPIDAGIANSSGGGVDAATSSSRQGLNRLQWSSDGRRMAVASGDKLHVLGVGEDVWKSKGDEEGRVMHNLVSRGLIQE